jgi:RNA polymerase sigma factor (sigma-70 family)
LLEWGHRWKGQELLAAVGLRQGGYYNTPVGEAMSSSGSVSQWIAGIKAGDEEAAARLWQRYYRRLLGLARRKLRDHPRRTADEEDIVVNAFHSFYQGARANRFPDLRDRNDLWHLIVRITERKAYDELRAQRRKKRGSGKVAGESVFQGPDASDAAAGIDQVPGPEPTPEFAAEMVEAVDGLLALLDDDEMRRIAIMKLEGYTNEEIAGRIGRSLPTVERRLKMIRTLWIDGEGR